MSEPKNLKVIEFYHLFGPAPPLLKPRPEPPRLNEPRVPPRLKELPPRGPKKKQKQK